MLTEQPKNLELYPFTKQERNLIEERLGKLLYQFSLDNEVKFENYATSWNNKNGKNHIVFSGIIVKNEDID